MNKLNIFVSSTCYDLSQIRVDMHEFIDKCGYSPILSEFRNFPVSPDKNTLQNCINTVKSDADIFVLIIGNRYGSQIESGQSITNIEFLSAKEKGIPIYIFINKNILNFLYYWKKNKGGDFTDIVDTIKIFEFVSEIRDNEKLWTFEFETAQDIISVLKIQFSYLFKDALNLKAKYNGEIGELYKLNLSGEALRIIIEKHTNYEIKFFFQVLIDEIKKKESLKNDIKYEIILNSKFIALNPQSVIDWSLHRIEELKYLINSINNLINKTFQIFYKEHGLASDLKGLFYTAETYVRIYESIIHWSIDTMSTYVNEESLGLKDKLSKFTHKLIEDVWNFPFDKLELINKVIKDFELGHPVPEITLTLKLELGEDAMNNFLIELQNFKNFHLGEMI